MRLIDEPLPGLKLIEPTVFEDHRGYFFESYREDTLQGIGITEHFVQNNQSLSKAIGVLRGLHFQIPPKAQAKLIRVIQGEVLDVVVDIRKKQETYGEVYSVALNEDNKRMLYVPAGFAHGFVTTKPNTIFAYQCSEYYEPRHERGLAWNDETLSIDWGISDPTLSEKDRTNESFDSFESPFS